MHNPTELQATSSHHSLAKMSHIEGLMRLKSTEAWLGLEGPLPRWLIHMVGKSFLSKGSLHELLECSHDMAVEFSPPEQAIWESKSHTVTYAIFFWWHRPSLIQCRRKLHQQGCEHQEVRIIGSPLEGWLLHHLGSMRKSFCWSSNFIKHQEVHTGKDLSGYWEAQEYRSLWAQSKPETSCWENSWVCKGYEEALGRGQVQWIILDSEYCQDEPQYIGNIVVQMD